MKIIHKKLKKVKIPLPPLTKNLFHVMQVANNRHGSDEFGQGQK